MKEINLLIKESAKSRDYYTDKLKDFFKVSFVDSVIENTLIIDGDHFVDWTYISSLISNENINFVFLEEYLEKSYKRDRYVDSGIKYSHNLEQQFLQRPLVRYESELVCSRPVLFLDRDGILNEDSGYVYKYDDSIIYKDMIKVIKTANDLSIPVVIVTNQAGVARGMYSVEDVDNFHSKLISYYSSFGAKVDHVEICPFHKDKGDEEWRFDSLLRKPNPGMHLKALAKVSGTILNSLMVGDKESDRISLEGINTFLLSGNYDMNLSPDVCSTRQELCEKISKYLNNLLDLS